MATSALAGYGGSVTGTSGALEVHQWEITLTMEALDATSMGSLGWREKIAGLTGGTGTFTTFTKVALQTSTASTATFTVGTGKTISGKILLGTVTHTTPVEGPVEWKVDFTFTSTITAGALT